MFGDTDVCVSSSWNLTTTDKIAPQLVATKVRVSQLIIYSLPTSYFLGREKCYVGQTIKQGVNALIRVLVDQTTLLGKSPANLEMVLEFE